MYYAVVYYPNLDPDKVEPFRQKYDPYAELIEPHLPFVFPVPDMNVVWRKWGFSGCAPIFLRPGSVSGVTRCCQ